MYDVKVGSCSISASAVSSAQRLNCGVSLRVSICLFFLKKKFEMIPEFPGRWWSFIPQMQSSSTAFCVSLLAVECSSSLVPLKFVCYPICSSNLVWEVWSGGLSIFDTLYFQSPKSFVIAFELRKTPSGGNGVSALDLFSPHLFWSHTWKNWPHVMIGIITLSV